MERERKRYRKEKLDILACDFLRKINNYTESSYRLLNIH
jgi:hypothetical protein